ncbi:MAG TPA: MMPL family transporter, partial [Dehalococcoidia bacterium]|nr:MMPL family transporter [Dehalococcoidia bacterium]
MDRTMRALARVVQRYPIAVVVVTMLAAFALSWGIPRVEFQTGQDTLLDPGSKLARDNARFQSQFGGDPMLVLFEAPDGSHILDLIADPDDRARLERLEQDLLATGQYHSVISPLTVVRFAMERVEQRMVTEPQRLAQRQEQAAAAARAESAARGESAAQQEAAAAEAARRVADEFQREFGPDAERFLALGDRTIDSREYLDFIVYAADGSIRPDIAGVFPDDRHALMVVRLAGNLSIDEGARVAAGIKEQTAQYDFEHAAPVVSGPPLLIKEINDGMRDAMVVMAVFAVAIMLVVLSLVFRARWRLLSLPAVLVGCV